jgi:myo-inositol-1(or 4)-monophosphatase
MELHRILNTARAAADDAVAVQRAHAGRVRPDDWGSKGTTDFVSFVDREAEAAMVSRIRGHFPGATILAEEDDYPVAGAHDPDGLVWILDPLDGTTNYLHRYPAYAASVGVVAGSRPVAGVVVSGATGERWHASAGGGAFRDDERIMVSGITGLERALIGTGFPFRSPDLLPAYLRQFDHVMRRTAGVRRAGSAALDLCHVASGWFDGFWEQSLAPWDVAGGALIVREAGGVVTRLNGDDDVLGHGSILAGNPAIHAALGRELDAALR